MNNRFAIKTSYVCDEITAFKNKFVYYTPNIGSSF